jgi:hypothetical protein
MYRGLADRTAFDCSRASGQCSLSWQGSGQPPQVLHSVPLSDVLGAYYQDIRAEVLPKAKEVLARAKTIDDVRGEDLFTRSSTVGTRASGQRVLIYTRRGLLPLTPTFDINSDVDVHAFNRSVADPKAGSFSMVVETTTHARLAAILPPILALVLIVVPGPRRVG